MVFNFLAGNDDEVMKLREKVKQLSSDNKEETQESSNEKNDAYESQTSQTNNSQENSNPNVELIDAERYAENERITNLVMQQIKELIEIDNNLNIKIKELENRVAQNTSSIANAKSIIEEFQKKMASFDKNMEKFLGLYEIITNRFNPFVSNNEENSNSTAKTGESIIGSSGIEKPEKQNSISITDRLSESQKGRFGSEQSGSIANSGGLGAMGADSSATGQTGQDIISSILSEKTIEDVEKKAGLSKKDIDMLRKDIYNMINSLGIELNRKIEQNIINTVNSTIERIVDMAVKKHIAVTEQQIEAFIKKNVFDKMSSKDGETEENTSELNKEVHPDFHFYLNDGTAVKSIGDLVNAIRQMDNDTFMSHISNNTNDFAEWIRLVKKDNALADEIAKMRTKEEIISKILEGVK